MKNILNFMIIALGFIVYLVLLASLAIVIYPSSVPSAAETDRWSLLPTIAISAGVLIAIITFTRDRKKAESEKIRHQSQIFFERASLAFDSVIHLLSKRVNDRIIWLQAARTLQSAVRLRDQINDMDYRHAYDLEAERARNQIYDSLTIEDSETGERHALPPQFFYGIKDWKACSSLDDAAIEASDQVRVYRNTIDSVAGLPASKYLSPSSVMAIYNFLEYTQNYDDPLDDVKRWDGDWEHFHGFDQGARKYVAHKMQSIVVNGKLKKLQKSNNG